METGPMTSYWDILVAAVLTLPIIEPGAAAKERTEQYRATLEELKRQGGIVVAPAHRASSQRPHCVDVGTQTH
jgi:hypothetical protein